jgi:hypothetical protein
MILGLKSSRTVAEEMSHYSHHSATVSHGTVSLVVEQLLLFADFAFLIITP